MRFVVAVLVMASCRRHGDAAPCTDLFYIDADGDGYGSLARVKTGCAASAGFSSTSDDCDDADAAVHPGATEICGGIDDDCDSSIDEGAVDSPVWYADNDGDGFGDETVTTSGCAQPSGYVAVAGDCDDTAFALAPCSISVSAADLVITGRDPEWDTWLGKRIRTGDLNGDGVPEIILGDGYANDFEGEAYVVTGPKTGAIAVGDTTVLSSGTKLGVFGWAVASGDVDHDGTDDLVVGAPNHPGQLYVFGGPITTAPEIDDADAILSGGDDEAGFDVAVVPDFAEEGTTEIAVGAIASGDYDAGAVFVATATAPGTGALRTHAAYIYEGFAGDQMLGWSTVSIGDHNGDGFGDLALAGRAAPPAGVPLWHVVDGGNVPGTYRVDVAASATLTNAHAVSGADYDADGYGDLIVGGPSGDVPDGVATVFAFLGPLTGPLEGDKADIRWEGAAGEPALDSLGRALATGDVDGDDEVDILMTSGGLGTVAYLQLGADDIGGVVDAGTLRAITSEWRGPGAAAAIVPDWTGDGRDEIALGSSAYTVADGPIAGTVYVLFSETLAEGWALAP